MLLTSRDRETNTLYADLAGTEDFLASHVISVSGEITTANGSVRDSRGKARQFTTVNGRTVMVKESFVYSNKGIFFTVISRTRLRDSLLQVSKT